MPSGTEAVFSLPEAVPVAFSGPAPLTVCIVIRVVGLAPGIPDIDLQASLGHGANYLGRLSSRHRVVYIHVMVNVHAISQHGSIPFPSPFPAIITSSASLGAGAAASSSSSSAASLGTSTTAVAITDTVVMDLWRGIFSGC